MLDSASLPPILKSYFYSKSNIGLIAVLSVNTYRTAVSPTLNLGSVYTGPDPFGTGTKLVR